MNSNKVIAIGGPTASGKTSLSLEIAHTYNGEIINCDSRQIYRRLDIGTAKEKIEKRHSDNSVTILGIRHHLIDHLDPEQNYTLADFQKDAMNIISDIHRRGKLPILVGGTGLYIDSVLQNFDLKDEPTDTATRESLNSLSVDELQQKLQNSSKDAWETLNESDKKNPHRLVRAIERTLTGHSDTYSKGKPLYDYLYIILTIPQQELEKRIEERVEKMFDEGLEEENRKLRQDGYSTELPALQTIGYKEFDDYFAGTQGLEETKELIITHTRQYSKRQRSWYRRNKDAIQVEDVEEAVELVKKFFT